MKFKKTFLILLFALTIFSISAVSAEDVDSNNTYEVSLDSAEILMSGEITEMPVKDTPVEQTGIISENMTKHYGDDAPFCANFTDKNGTPLANETVTFTINNVSYNKTTDSDGVAKLNITLESGKYIIATYNPSTNKTAINTINILSGIEGKDITKFCRNGTHYIAKLYDKTGKALVNQTVRFNIHGVFYNRTTDENGRVILNISLDPGKYVITVYNLVTGEQAANNVTVLSRMTMVDLVQKSKDMIIYVRDHHSVGCLVTVLDDLRKPLANQNVTLNVNGIIQNKTTGGNGTVEVWFALKEYKEYNICTATSGNFFVSQKLLTNRAFITGDDSKYQPSAVNAGKI